MEPPTANGATVVRPDRATPSTTTSNPKVATTSPNQSPRDDRSVDENVTASRSNIRLATMAPAHAPTSWAPMYAIAVPVGRPPNRRSASVTTGLKWAPETGPNATIRAASPAPVAAAFSSSWSPRSPGDRRWAAMPEPTTTATSSAVPTASAARRRARSRSVTPVRPGAEARRGPALPTSSAAAGCGLGRTGAAQRVGTRVDGAQFAGGMLGLGQHRVDLPRLAVGGVDPDLILHGVAARHLILGGARQALAGQARVGGSHLVGGRHLDAQVVERARVTVALDEHELERRLGNGEVGVAGAALGRLGREQLRVEADRRVDVGNVEGELHAGHASLLLDWRLSIHR